MSQKKALAKILGAAGVKSLADALFFIQVFAALWPKTRLRLFSEGRLLKQAKVQEWQADFGCGVLLHEWRIDQRQRFELDERLREADEALVLFCVKKGCLRVESQAGLKVTFEAGEGFFADQRDFQLAQIQGQTLSCEATLLILKPSHMRGKISYQLHENLLPRVSHLQFVGGSCLIPKTKGLKDCVDRLPEPFRSTKPVPPGPYLRWAEEALLVLTQTHQRGDSFLSRAALELLQEAVDAGTSLDVKELLEALPGVSDYRLRRALARAGYGSAKKAEVHLRLLRAATLLRQQELSVAKVAQDCGWQSVSKFITAFASRYGVTPYQYQKKRTLE